MACGRHGRGGTAPVIEPTLNASTAAGSAHAGDGTGRSVQRIMDLMRQAGVEPDEIAYGAAIDAYRRSGLALEAVECLQAMVESGLEPSAAHYNLVLRSLKVRPYANPNRNPNPNPNPNPTLHRRPTVVRK